MSGDIYFVGDFLQAIQRSDVVQCVYRGRKPSVQAEDLQRVRTSFTVDRVGSASHSSAVRSVCGGSYI